MSILIRCNGEHVWFPAMAGVLFHDHIRSLERLLERASGVSEIISDEITIDVPTFAAFVDALVHQLEMTNHGFLFALAAGSTAVALALTHRLTGAWPTVSPKLDPVLANARALRTHLG